MYFLHSHVHFCFCADDMLIKLWDWEKKWSCSQVFEGHTHYVMQIVINPKDNNQFASASLDRTIKVETAVAVVAFTAANFISSSAAIKKVSEAHPVNLCYVLWGVIRFGSLALRLPISLWRVTRKESIALTTTVEETSPTSSQGLMIAKSRSGTTRLEKPFIHFVNF